MKHIDLESAQRIVNDPEAIRRNYLNQEILDDAIQLAQAVRKMPDFGKIGYLTRVGCPENYWVENCPKYAEMTAKYSNDSQHSCLIQITESLVSDDKREIAESRWTALELLRKLGGLDSSEQEEYVILSHWLGFPAKK